MFNTALRCFHFKIWDQTEGIKQTGKEGQVINHDLTNVHFLSYMDIKGVSCSALTFTPSQLISLDLLIVHIWYTKGVCHAHILSKDT